MVHSAKQVISQRVVAGINHQEHIVAANGILHQALGIAALESGAVAADDKGLAGDTGFIGPVDKMGIDLLGQDLCAGAGDQSQGCFLLVRTEKINGGNGIVGHRCSPPLLYMSVLSR